MFLQCESVARLPNIVTRSRLLQFAKYGDIQISLVAIPFTAEANELLHQRVGGYKDVALHGQGQHCPA